MRKMLMLTDREEISRGLAESLEYQEIGRRLGRDSSVISREVTRHGGRARYRAAAAHEAARAGRERPKLFAVERSPRLRAVVCRQLRQGWSPASIAGRLPTEYAADESCRVCAGSASNSCRTRGCACGWSPGTAEVIVHCRRREPGGVRSHSTWAVVYRLARTPPGARPPRQPDALYPADHTTPNQRIVGSSPTRRTGFPGHPRRDRLRASRHRAGTPRSYSAHPGAVRASGARPG